MQLQAILTRATTYLAILAIAALTSASAHATVIIDNFTTVFDVTGEAGWNGTNGNAVGPRSNVTTLAQTGVGGAVGDRTATFTGDNPGNGLIIIPDNTIDSSGNFVAAPGTGVLTVNTNAGSLAFNLILDYDVTDLDLSAESRFEFNMSGDLDDHVPAAFLPFDIELTSGANTSTAGVTLGADGAYEILFSSFVGIDFSDIDGITITSWDGVTSPDYAISEIVATPEPGTGLLVGLGMGLMGWSRRRASRAS